jgi:hypothetical protein
VAAAARVAGGDSEYLATPPATRALPLRVRGGYNHKRWDHQSVEALRFPSQLPPGAFAPQGWGAGALAWQRPGAEVRARACHAAAGRLRPLTPSHLRARSAVGAMPPPARPTVTVMRAAWCLSLTLPVRRSAHPVTIHTRGERRAAGNTGRPPLSAHQPHRNDEAGAYAAGLTRLGVDFALPFPYGAAPLCPDTRRIPVYLHACAHPAPSGPAPQPPPAGA